MAQRSPRKTVIGTIVLFFILAVQLSIGYRYFDPNTELESSGYLPDTALTGTTAAKPHSPNATMGNKALRYIPHSTVQTWSERDYLIVFGIPSVDSYERRRRRYLQRDTCWKFPGVAQRANNFTGDMLVLYLLARHPSHGYRYSAALLKEAAQRHDVVALPMNDALPTTRKIIGENGYWGNEAEIGMSRKTYLWYELALRLFPSVSYIAKGDDDMFLRVPQFLADLRTLPGRGIYRGKVGTTAVPVLFSFVIGFCATLSRDVAEHFVSYKPLQRLVYTPYSKEQEAEFLSMYMHHEDMMIGLALHKLLGNNITFVREPRCRFHDLRRGFQSDNVTSSSVVMHHTKEEDYEILMNMFRNDTNPRAKGYMVVKNNIEFPC